MYFAVLLLILLPTQATFTQSNSNAPEINNLVEEKPLVNKDILKILLALIALECYFFSGRSQEQNNLKQQLQPSNLLQNFAVEYCTRLLITFMHEAGHAVTANVLNDDHIDIHMGAHAKDHLLPFLTIGPVGFEGLSPINAYTTFKVPYEKNHDDQDIERKKDTSASPVIIITSVLLSRYCKRNNIKPDTIDSKKISKIIKRELENLSNKDKKILFSVLDYDKVTYGAILLSGGISGALSNLVLQQCKRSFTGKNQPLFDSIMSNQLINLLLPYGETGNSDAFKFYERSLGVPTKLLEYIAQISPVIDMSAELYLTHRDATSPDVPLHSKMFMGVVNYLLRGFFRFQA